MTSRLSPFLERADNTLASSRRPIWILFVSSFLLKLVYVIQSADALHVTVPILDSQYYVHMARDILAGNIIRDQVFFMGPLYPYTLASIFGLLGEHIMAVRIVQVLGGSLTVVLTYLVGARVFRPTTALAGAIILLLYGATTFYEGQLLMMWLGTILNMALLYVMVRGQDDPGLKKYLVAGFLLGVSALARANILVFLPVILLWVGFVGRENRRLTKAFVLVAVMTVTLLPAPLHNWAASRDVVPITSNGGINFFIGNSEDATGIFYPPRGINRVTQDAVNDYVQRTLGRPVSDSESSRYWFGEALDFIKRHPGREARLLLRKTAMFFNGYEVPQVEPYDVYRARYPALRLLFVSFWMIVAPALFAMVYLVKEWRRYFLLYGFVLSFALSIVLFFVTARYRVQVAPVLSLFAAYALLEILPAATTNLRRGFKAALLLAALVFVTRPGLFAIPHQDVVWREHIHEARRLSEIQRFADAIDEIDKAVEIHPDYPDSYIQRAAVNKERGHQAEVIRDYSRALEIAPDLPTVHYDLAQALRRAKMYEPAVESYRNAIRLSPRMLEAYNNLGITYHALRRHQEAIDSFRRVVELDPGYTKAYNNLGAALAEAGRMEQAVGAFKSAIETDPQFAPGYKNLAMSLAQLSRARDAYDSMGKYLALQPDDSQAREFFNRLRRSIEEDTMQVAP